MSIGLKRKDPEVTIRELYNKVIELTAERDIAQRDAAMLQGQLNKNPELMWWSYAKIHRQTYALNLLNRRVVSQRMVLREIERLGRGLTKAEYQQAREAISDEKLRERTEKEYAVTI